jgi:predicted nucleic-acid-binding Zn-ribbon protein
MTMVKTQKCPKCNNEMELGNEIAAGTVSPEMNWVKDGKTLKLGAPKIFSYSCLKCGYIESYVDRK